MADEEAILITEESIEIISSKYDVFNDDVLRARLGAYFVGEVDCDYWFGILSTERFAARYVFSEQGDTRYFRAVHRVRVPVDIT